MSRAALLLAVVGFFGAAPLTRAQEEGERARRSYLSRDLARAAAQARNAEQPRLLEEMRDAARRMYTDRRGEFICRRGTLEFLDEIRPERRSERETMNPAPAWVGKARGEAPRSVPNAEQVALDPRRPHHGPRLLPGLLVDPLTVCRRLRRQAVQDGQRERDVGVSRPGPWPGGLRGEGEATLGHDTRSFHDDWGPNKGWVVQYSTKFIALMTLCK